MRALSINPTDYESYRSDRLLDRERVYHLHFGTIGDAYAIREEGETLEEFCDEAEYQLWQRTQRISLMGEEWEDVTGIFDEQEDQR